MTALVGPTAARQRVDRIKTGVEVIWSLVVESYQQRDWEALGYSSWDEMCTREFGTSHLRLPREERVETVQSLRDSGLSYPAIAAATGLGYGTVHRAVNDDSSGCPDGQPEPDAEEVFDPETGEVIMQIEWVDKPVRAVPDWVDAETGEVSEDIPAPEPSIPVTTGMDGKQYPRAVPKPGGGSKRQTPLVETAKTRGFAIRQATDSVQRIFDDPRYRTNEKQVADVLRGHLLYVAETVAAVIDQLP